LPWCCWCNSSNCIYVFSADDEMVSKKVCCKCNHSLHHWWIVARCFGNDMSFGLYFDTSKIPTAAIRILPVSLFWFAHGSITVVFSIGTI